MFNPDVVMLSAVMRRKGYKFFIDGDYNLNLIAVRHDRRASDKFDDVFTVSFKVGGVWQLHAYPCTTDPGLYWLRNGLDKGTACLAPGQYRNAYKIGLHKGKEDALVQYRPVTVYRDANKDDKLDYVSPETGLFGINIHRARADGTSTLVDKWSAGCTVFANSRDHAELMNYARIAAGKYGNSFTYTLLEEEDFA